MQTSLTDFVTGFEALCVLAGCDDRTGAVGARDDGCLHGERIFALRDDEVAIVE